ncbi:ATP-binding cassette domain-containing protein [uncultured Paraburkholderia sp.]|uniref:ATP-binding cassette domain-containing protein n=1 Tax=uncultured Paraburkholderia sp. TaxID=1822466 RepID=UPI002593F86E|nr:ATP-binding cassette domain-containing protein [uncultured Paraburkholderia sp.]
MARIEFQNLAHAYRPNPATLDDYALQPMSMVWEDGGAYALLGPSGCGKTTLLNIVSGLVKPSEGKVLFDGRDVTALGARERNIAQVFQFPGDLRHHERVRQPRVPAAQPQNTGSRSQEARARSRRHSRHDAGSAA